MRKLSYLLLPFALLLGIDAYAVDLAACKQATALQAQIQAYHNEYNSMGSKNPGRKQQLKAQIIQADQELKRVMALCGDCTQPTLQKDLTAGLTPADIYNACGKKVSVLRGLQYKGGLIAYFNPLDGTGFVAAPADSRDAIWASRPYPAVSGTRRALYTGNSNTAAIIAAQGSPGSNPQQGQPYKYAAWLSEVETFGPYSDWVLPSSDELNEVVQYVPTACGAGSTASGKRYWSSTQGPDQSQAVIVACRSGFPQSSAEKNTVASVRLIRYYPVPTPVIITFVPLGVAAGSTLTINGSNFSPTARHNTVTFTGGATAVATAATATSLTVTVPAGALTGPFTVTTNGETSPPSGEVPARPCPYDCQIWDSKSGSCLGAPRNGCRSSQQQSRCPFNCQVWNPPSGSCVGAPHDWCGPSTKCQYDCQAWDPATRSCIGSAMNGCAPTSLTVRPGITSFSPAASYVGGTITINGTNFSATPQNNNIVRFSGNNATSIPSNATPTTLTVTIPRGAASGPIVVGTGGVNSTASTSSLNLFTPMVHPTGVQATLGSIYNAGSVLVAAGQQGTVLTSGDGNIWTLQKACGPTTYDFTAFGYGTTAMAGTALINGKSYLCGTTGNAWSLATVPNWAPRSFVQQQNGTLVAVSQNQSSTILATSTNGKTWNTTQTVKAGDVIAGLVFNGSQLLGLGRSSNAYISTTNGSTWTVTPLSRRLELSGFIWSGTLKMYGGVEGGNVVTSTDGLNWTRQSNAGSGLEAIAWSDSLGLFMAVGGTSAALASSDGVNWSSIPLPSGVSRLKAITAYGSGFIAVGEKGTVVRLSTTTQ